jgi:hypothetical protein
VVVAAATLTANWSPSAAALMLRLPAALSSL